jgi:hypothetical protein
MKPHMKPEAQQQALEWYPENGPLGCVVVLQDLR